MKQKITLIVAVLFSVNLMADETPEAPINIGAYNFTDTSVRLSFKDLSDNEDGFRVYYDNSIIAEVDAKEGTGEYNYIDLTDLESCKLYTIELVSYNSSGESAPLSKSFRTIGCDSAKESSPATPTNIGAYNFTATGARLSFKDLSDNEDGFRVYYDNSIIAEIGAKEGTGEYSYINLTNLESCKLYTVDLVSYNSVGNSLPITKSFRTLGCSSNEDKNVAPTVDAGADINVTLGNSITITGSGSDSDGTIVSYEWKIEDRVLSNDAKFDYTPDTKGVDILTLTVTDDDGAKASDSMKVYVAESRDEDSNDTAVDITKYGATPDDDTDDTEAIKKALSVSGSITMPTGVYIVKGLTRVGKTLIDGNGSTFKSIRTDAGTSANILTLKTEDDTDRIWIKDLKLDGDCPTQYPRVGEHVASLLHIYDSKNILLEGMKVVDFSSQYHSYDLDAGDEPEHLQINNDHSLDMPYSIFITFSRNIAIKNMEQKNIKIEGPLVYESDDILIEDFKSADSVNIWTALHVVASDNILMNRVDISDGLVNSTGSSVNFFANHHFTVSNTNTIHKNGFDISNEVVGVPSGRVTRDTSYGTFINCRFEGYHPVQGYPTKNIHEDLKFINTQFISSRVEKGAYGVRLQKAGEVLFDNCIFGNDDVPSRFNMIMGDTKKLTIKNSKFINTQYDEPLAAGIYILGGEYGDINVTGNSFAGVNYSPVLFIKNDSKEYGSSGVVNEFRFLDNRFEDEDEFEYGVPYKNFDLTINKIVD